MAARPGHGAGHEDAHPSHAFQGHEGLVSRHGDFDFRLDLPAQIPQGPARRRQRPQLIDDHIAVAVHRIAAVAVVFAATDRDADLITGSKKVIVLRGSEGGGDAVPVVAKISYPKRRSVLPARRLNAISSALS